MTSWTCHGTRNLVRAARNPFSLTHAITCERKRKRNGMSRMLGEDLTKYDGEAVCEIIKGINQRGNQ